MATGTKPHGPAFKPRFKWEVWGHERWTYLFCRGGAGREPCAMFEKRARPAWYMDSDFCKAFEGCIHDVDVEVACPRRDEVSARLHAMAVARVKAAAKEKHEYEAAHPREKAPKPKPKTHEEQIADALNSMPEGPSWDYSDLF
jgi:hypothetical protein